MEIKKIDKYTTTGRKRSEEEMREMYFSNYKVKCKCSHTMIMTNNKDKTICTYCGRPVYRTKQAEFRDKVMKELKNVR